MIVPYTIRFTVERRFEARNTDHLEGDNVLTNYADKFRKFQDHSVDLIELRDEAGKLNGYDAIGQIEDSGEAMIPDSFAGKHIATALAILAEFRAKATECLAEISDFDDLTVEFRPTMGSSPIRFSISRMSES